jgi:hypothetical protein
MPRGLNHLVIRGGESFHATRECSNAWITPGHPWPQLIRDRLNGAEVVLIMIGRDWLKVQDGESFQRCRPGDRVELRCPSSAHRR